MNLFPNKKVNLAVVSLTVLLFLILNGCRSQTQERQPGSKGSQDGLVSLATPSLGTSNLNVPPHSPLLRPLLQGNSVSDSHPLAQFFTGRLSDQGAPLQNQGLWVQSEDNVIASYQASRPLSAASVTKVATSLAALKTLGPDFRFVTQIGTLGEIKDGVLQGDLVIQGGDDPFFVWEDAIALGNLLKQLGVTKVTGSLLVSGPFKMNFESEASVSANFFLQAINQNLWTETIDLQYQTLPQGTPRPQIQILGQVQQVEAIPTQVQWQIKHASLPLIELLKRMNRFSNNPMADQLANHLGGASQVTRLIREITHLPDDEVVFTNGSGLGESNQISCRGAVLIVKQLSELLTSMGLKLGDVMTVVGQDEGILDSRPLPVFAVVKSGTLNSVSALVGAVPSESEGVIWFAILNNDGNVEAFRQIQESLLQNITDLWGIQRSTPTPLSPTLTSQSLKTINELIR